VSRIVGDQGREGERAWNILRLGLGALLAMNVMMISLLLYTGSVEPQAVPVFRWVMLALAAPAMAILVYPFAVGAAGEIRRGRLSLDTLIAVGSLAAFAASAGATIHGTGHVYFDTATMLPVLVTFGKLIEATAKTRVGRLVRGLETLLPATALRDGPDGPREAPVSELRVGDRIRVRPGERVAVDGRIIEGATTIEEAAFTGESRPRLCGPGDQVIAGTVNGQGAVLVEAGRIGEDLLAARMIEMVEQARRQASPSQRMAERLAAVFTPLVLALAAVAGLYWFWTEGPPQAGFAALSVLVVACPCAMGIAASLATALAVGRAARAGVLVRGGDVLERAGRIRTVFFDKTGTVTAGRPVVAAVESQDPDLPPEEILGWLAGLESASEHALARAVADEAAKRSIFVGAVRGLAVVPGMGIRGSVTRGGATREIVAGTEALVGSAGPPDPAAADGAATVVAVGWGGRLRGRVLFRDSVRPDAAAAVRALRDAGITPVLLSGDSAGAAQAVAAEVGIDRVEAPRRPDEKIEVLRAAGRAGGAVAMVGDGINDAPALASADVGIAMGAGTDLARQAGHVVLLADRLTRIPWLVALSRQTRRVTRQNLLWAFGYNAAALAAAATGHLHPLLAAVAMVVSSLTVLANSLRLQRFPETP
jgi:heavy metal translocating P-type ATPase